MEYFFTLNPHKLKLASLGYEKKKTNDLVMHNMICHLQGKYVAEALNSTVCNMFRKKGAEPYKYPKEPYEFDFRSEEQKKQDAVDEFFARQKRNRELWRKKHNKSGAE